ncbi:MAG: hypothetical protein J0L56_16110 [Chitinophagales bacterium]|nr:hypothetical protein [Chitinophagales bacterium]
MKKNKKLSVINEARINFHKSLLKSVLTIDSKGVPSNADKDQKSSVLYAKSIAEQLKTEVGERLAGQSSGHQFEQIVASFIQETFTQLHHLRPGKWQIFQVGSRNRLKIAEYSQYEHLILLQNATKDKPELAASLGNDYTITPDVIIARERETDEFINSEALIIDNDLALLSDIRLSNGKSPILHASISTKWTLRSDRAQNARSEALNLIRNRKGKLPHVIVVTGEPTPSRLASIALGTGDIDCVYHFALNELKTAIKESGNDEALNMLQIMIDGKRLKDISDLPLDLAI